VLRLRRQTRLLGRCRQTCLLRVGGSTSLLRRGGQTHPLLGLRNATRFLFGLSRATSVILRSTTRRLVGGSPLKFGLGSANALLGLRKATLLLLGLCDSPSFCLGLSLATGLFCGTTRGLVGGFPLKFSLGSPKCLLGLRKTTRLLLGLCGSPSFRFGLRRAPSVFFRSTTRLLLGSFPLKFSLGNTKCLLGLRKTSRLLLGLCDSTSFLLSLCRPTRVFIRAPCLLLGSLAFELGLGSAKSFFGFRKTTRLLLRLGDSTSFLLGLCRTTGSFIRGAACLLLRDLAVPLGPGGPAGFFLGLARGDCSRKLLTPERFLRVDGVALGKSLPLLRKLLDLDRRPLFPHHLGTIEIIPATRKLEAPEED
jgi:hypothetical protein